jgi:hypothetical protein
MIKRGIAALLLLAAGCDGSVAGGAPDGAAGDGGVEAGAPAGPLSAETAVVDFGCVDVGAPVAYGVPIGNRGPAPVGPLAADLTPSTAMLSILTDGCGGLTLAGGEACIVSIFFMAPAVVEVAATLEVTAPGVPPLRLPVRAHTLAPCR